MNSLEESLLLPQMLSSFWMGLIGSFSPEWISSKRGIVKLNYSKFSHIQHNLPSLQRLLGLTTQASCIKKAKHPTQAVLILEAVLVSLVVLIFSKMKF